MSALDNVPLVLWAGCLRQHKIIDRAEGMAAGGFESMSLFTKDLAAWEEQGGTIAGLRAELDAREAPVICIDPYLGWYPGYDPRAATGERAAFLQATEEDILRFTEAMGATYVSLVAPYDDNRVPFDAVVDRLGRFADRAARDGLRAQLEVVPTSKVDKLATAARLVRAVGRPNLGLLLDTYNLARSGATPPEVEALPHELVFAMQLADGTADPPAGGYRFESLHSRLHPGEGELPVADMVRPVLQRRPFPPIGPEVLHDELGALRTDAAGRRCAEATRRFLQGLCVASTEQPGLGA